MRLQLLLPRITTKIVALEGSRVRGAAAVAVATCSLGQQRTWSRLHKVLMHSLDDHELYDQRVSLPHRRARAVVRVFECICASLYLSSAP